MPTVVTTSSQAGPRDVYIIYKPIASAVKAVGTGRCGMGAQLPWGPINTQTDYTDAATFRASFAPDGFDRTGQGYLMATKFPWIDLQVVRVLGAGAAKATINIQNSVPANEITVAGLYFGAAGNGISVVISAATDAVATHFNMTVSKTDTATGLNTTEVWENVDSTQAAGAYWTNLTTVEAAGNASHVSKLVTVTKLSTSRPVNGTYTLASGSDGTIGSAHYLGTPGNADAGLAVFENDADLNFVFTDDPGSSLLAAVMAGIKAHVLYMNDRRIGMVMGLPAETQATAKTNVALNTGDHVKYVYPHGKVYDDQGTLRVIPLTGPQACLESILTAHLSCAIKKSDFTKYMSSIVGLDASTANKTARAALEKAGIVAWEKNSDGTFSPYDDVMADGTTPGYVTRMRDYIAFSVADALSDFRNSPNDSETFDDERAVFEDFIETLKKNKTQDHIFLPSIEDGALLPVEATNTAASIAAGDAVHGAKIRLISENKRIFLSIEAGTTVTVTPSIG